MSTKHLIHQWLETSAEELYRFLKAELPLDGNKWYTCVHNHLSATQQNYLRGKQNDLGALDFSALLRVFEMNWDRYLGKKTFSCPAGKLLIFTTRNIRNTYSHKSVIGSETPPSQLQAELDTLLGFLRLIYAPQETLARLQRDIDSLSRSADKTLIPSTNSPVSKKPILHRKKGEITPIDDAIEFPEELKRHLIFQYRTERKEAEKVGFPQNMLPILRQFLQNKKDMSSLYTHQAEMFDAVLNGKNVVITTSTASGKTLGFQLPIFQTILDNPRSRAILIYPTKALTYDQWKSIQNDAEHFGSNRIVIGRYDADTSTAEKEETLQRANIILTNPEMIHRGMLPYKGKWKNVLENLRFVVLDELHTYQGAFGAHLANVLKRLNRVCEYYRSQPQYVCCSATIGNPKELAEEMTGREMSVIEKDGSPRSPRNYYFFDSGPRNDETTDDSEKSKQSPQKRGPIYIASQGIKALFDQPKSKRKQFIAFVKARESVERLQRKAMEETGNKTIRGFSAKDTPDYRTETAESLKKGINHCLGVISTNALELGIDIGSIQSVVIMGFPRTRASFLQQAGRAGRQSNETSHCLLATDGSPLSKFVNHQPEWVFNDKQMEKVVINSNHVSIQIQHLKAAAYELSLTEADEKWYPHLKDKLKILVRENRLKKSFYHQYVDGKRIETPCYESVESESPALAINLRCSDSVSYTFVPEDERDDEIEIPKVLEEHYALRELYKGAVHEYNGKTYLVVENGFQVDIPQLKRKANAARGIPFESKYHTKALQSSEVKLLLEREFRRLADGLNTLNANTVHFGDVEILLKVTGFKICCQSKTGEEIVLGYQKYAEQCETGEHHAEASENWEQDKASDQEWNEIIQTWKKYIRFSPDDQMEAEPKKTKAVWVELPSRFHELFQVDGRISHYQNDMSREVDKNELFGAVAHALLIAAKVKCMCSDSDLTFYIGMANRPAPWLPSSHSGETAKEFLCFYDLFPGGLGFVEKMFGIFEEIVRFAIENIQNCHCQDRENENGIHCPSCPDCAGPVDEGSNLLRENIIYVLEGYLNT